MSVEFTDDAEEIGFDAVQTRTCSSMLSIDI